MLEVSQHSGQAPSLNSLKHIQRLSDEHTNEVLTFLSARPLHTFIKSSWIKDNGLVSPHNRGTFYAYRGATGRLEGVALIGHITLFEARTNSALAAFAELTRNCPSVHVVLSEENKLPPFFKHYLKGGPEPRLVCRELLLEKRSPEYLESVQTLRPATSDELDLIVPVHAQTAFEESGVNPLDVDAVRFRERCARRISRGRVWIAVEDGRLKFKADVVSDTPDAIYLEGVYVSPEHRGNGYGARCLTQLTNHLLESTKSVCLLVNEKNSCAQTSYRKAGYLFREYYDTLYFPQQSSDANPAS